MLIEIVTRHIKDEEQNWFPEVRKGLGRKQLQNIGGPMANLRKKAGTRRPPRAPSPNGTATSTPASKQDVVDLLIQQHNQIRDLFVEVEAASGAAQLGAFRRLVRLLAIHETAEEQAVHPVARLHF